MCAFSSIPGNKVSIRILWLDFAKKLAALELECSMTWGLISRSGEFILGPD